MISLKSATASMIALAMLTSVSAAAPAKLALAKAPQVGIGLKTNKASPSLLKSQIRRQALKQGVKLSAREVNAAVHHATNQLKSNGRDPLKGIIHLKFKRFTICISWGKDKGYCENL